MISCEFIKKIENIIMCCIGIEKCSISQKKNKLSPLWGPHIPPTSGGSRILESGHYVINLKNYYNCPCKFSYFDKTKYIIASLVPLSNTSFSIYVTSNDFSGYELELKDEFFS